MAITTPTSFWNLDGNPNDALGVNNGTNHSNTYVSGLIGQASSMTGGSYISVANNSSLNVDGGGAFTISVWVKFTTLSGFVRLYDKGQAGTGNGYYLDCNSSTIRLLGATTFSASKSLSTGVWYHIVAKYNGSGTAQIYVNGSSIGSGAGLYTSAYSGELRLGLASDGTAALDGLIDATGFWKGTALTGTEITELYNSGNGLQYPFTYSATAGNGSFTLTGGDTTAVIAIVTTAGNGSFTLTGGDSSAMISGGWSNQTKNTSNWGNLSKNNTSWTNQTKS